MTPSETLKELLLAAGAVDMAQSVHDDQPQFDVAISDRHRLHLVFDAGSAISQTVTVSLLTIDGAVSMQGDSVSGLDVHRVGVYPVALLITFLQSSGPFISDLFPLKPYHQILS